MRRFPQYLPALLISSLAAYPLISDLPDIVDGPSHFYRIAALDWHIRHFDFYPRWFSDLHYGFGAPVLNFYSPLSYYVVMPFSLLGVSIPLSYAIGFYLAFVCMGLGIYKWMRELNLSATASLVAVAGYLFAPHIYMNTIHRGAYPENWGLAILPWLFWATLKLGRDSNRKTQITFTLIYAALILTHNLMAFILSPLISIYFVFVLITYPSLSLSNLKSLSPKIIRHIPLIVLGVALAAFYVVPVVFEVSNVFLTRTTVLRDFSFSFSNIEDLFLLPQPYDPYRMGSSSIQHTFALPQLVIFLIGLVSAGYGWLMTRRDSSKTQWSMFILHSLLFIAIAFFTLHVAEPLWNLFPLARFIQTPKRLLGPASIMLGTMAAMGTHLIEVRFPKRGIWISGLGILAFFLFSLSWTYHHDFVPYPLRPTPADGIKLEINTKLIGTTYDSEFVPRIVSEFPKADLMLPRYEASPLPSHLAPTPEGVNCQTSSIKLKEEEVKCDSTKDYVVGFYQFYFPGWTATVDGKPINITPSQPNGYITVNVPAGSHTIKFSLQPTLPQIAGTIISLIAGCWLLVVSRQPITITHSPSTNYQLPATNYQLLFSSSLIVLLFLARIFYLDRNETIFRYTQINSLPNSTSINFGDHLELMGFTTPPATVSSGGTLDFTLYWRGLNLPMTEDYSVTVQMADRFGNRFGQSDTEHPDLMPTSHWNPNEYAHDVHHLRTLVGVPPGEYRLLLSVHRKGIPLSLMRDGVPNGVEYELSKVIITRGATHPPGKLRLIESSVATQELSVGDQLAFTVLWNSGNDSTKGVTATLSLTDSREQTIFAKEFAPAGVDYLPEQWNPNELILYPHTITLPPDLKSGKARVRITLNNGSTFDLGEVLITVPTRDFNIPQMQKRIDHVFNESIRLLGYNIAPDSITLYWQSVKPVDKRLTIFVHRLNGSTLVTGHDSAPARATTSWITNEVISTTHPLAVGGRFEIGLYDPVTGERFDSPVVITNP